MSYIHTYLNVAEQLLNQYTPPQPFHLYIKKYFSANKKHGSRDRKTIAALCYAYFRLGKSFANYSTKQKLLLGISLCHQELLNEKWVAVSNEEIPALEASFFELSLNQKVQFLQQNFGFDLEQLFPTIQELSSLTNRDPFLTSILNQNLVWLRVRRNKKEKVELLLKEKSISYINHPNIPDAIGFEKINIEEVFGKNHHHWVEVQDASSQQTDNFILVDKQQKIWDCCCGAGGKSLMLKDSVPEIELYCSDVRPQILSNLQNRFKQSAIPIPFCAVTDLSNNATSDIVFETKEERRPIQHNYFDTIIADVPCSGSGTWGRTPEQAYYFDESQIEVFSQKQKTIVTNAIPFLKTGGKLYYITCSVFKKENEEQVAYFEKQGLKQIQYQLIEGYSHKADTMFIAEFEKA